jgi:hypothetical protein
MRKPWKNIYENTNLNAKIFFVWEKLAKSRNRKVKR